MGVRYLWSILTSTGRQLLLSDLAGKTLAVDLSGWVCQALNCHKMTLTLHKPHLRNLFFRIQNMYHLGINLVFVVDGEATRMKWQTMNKRAKADGFMFSRSNGRRSRLQYYVTECCQMLDLMGIPYLKSQGEAEAFCALLNSVGMVHGVLTDDTDALLYGAPTVFKSVSTGSDKLSHNSVMCYDMPNIEKDFGLSRDSLIALALLLGCDYLPEGVHGIGRETVVKLIEEKKGVNLLERLSWWKSSEFDSAKLGPIESAVYKKAMAAPNFPNVDVIQEFKVIKDSLPSEPSIVSWKQPDFPALHHFICSQLGWKREYVNKKILVLMTQWAIRQHLYAQKTGIKHSTDIQPLRILKHRISSGVHLSEVEWMSLSGTMDGNFCTVEMESQFKEAFPTLYAEFMYEKASKKTSKRKKGTTKIQSEVRGALCVECEPEKAIKKTTKRKKDIAKIQPEAKEASPSVYEPEKIIQKTKKRTTEMQSEVSHTLCTENEQERKNIKKKKAGTLRSPLKDKNQTSTKSFQCLSQQQQQCSFSSCAGSDSEDELLPLFERIHLDQRETTPHDCMPKQCSPIETGSLGDPIVID